MRITCSGKTWLKYLFECSGLKFISSAFIKKSIFSLLMVFLAVSSVLSDVDLTGVFGDNMVLQRGMKVPVWGTAVPGEKITITINGKSVKTSTGKDGHWMIKLNKMKAGGPYVMTVDGNNSVSFNNIMIGDVWICSGQSNMAWPMERVRNIEEDIASADYPDIRMFNVHPTRSETPLYDFSGVNPEWISVTPETVGKFSAMAFLFGRELYRELHVPIGLMQSSAGGSVLEAWMSRESLESEPVLVPIIEYWEAIKENWPEVKERYDREVAEWEKAQAAGYWVPEKPAPLRGPQSGAYYSCIYNASIAPMIPYGIKGMIWCQGASNTVRAWQYRTQFPTMIRGWRKAWNQGDFPFIYVQQANWETETWTIHGRALTWPEIREAQLMTLSVPNTAMVVTIDIGDEYNAHYNNKWDVSHRLVLAALHLAYERDVVYSGPLYESMKIEGNSIRLRFTHIADGLISSNGEPVKGFTLAAEDREFYEANARSEGNEVVVISEKVGNPVAVRYGWDDNPVCTLYNSAGLPASPFRTDDWPGTTDGMLIPYNRHNLYFWYPKVIR